MDAQTDHEYRYGIVQATCTYGLRITRELTAIADTLDDARNMITQEIELTPNRSIEFIHWGIGEILAIDIDPESFVPIARAINPTVWDKADSYMTAYKAAGLLVGTLDYDDPNYYLVRVPEIPWNKIFLAFHG